MTTFKDGKKIALNVLVKSVMILVGFVNQRIAKRPVPSPTKARPSPPILSAK